MRVLLVDDDPAFSNMLSGFLKRNQLSVEVAHSGRSALAALGSANFDLALVDYRLPDTDGLALIRELKSSNPDLAVILITNYKDIRTAVNSIKLGAYEFVTKPVIPDELLLVIQGALRAREQVGQPTPKDTRQEPGYIIGQSVAASRTWEHIHLVAPTKMTVLIYGESGTGKEYAARMIHQKSRRAAQPFVAVDCGVLSRDLAASELFGHVKGAFTGAMSDKMGCFEQANKGTLFLDEIGNLPADVQVQLLRAIQERTVRRVGSAKEIPVDVRIIAATNEHLKTNIDEGLFRMDLYHRLNEFTLELEPLRSRPDDLEEYLQAFLQQASEELEKPAARVDPAALALMKRYSWPGNLRELKNVIKRGVLLSSDGTITLAHLPADLSEEDRTSNTAVSFQPDLKALQEQNEKEMILKVLEDNRWNKSKAAKLLNIDRKTLYAKLEKYGIDT